MGSFSCPLSIDIECPRTVVAAYVSDPDNATEGYVNIKSVDWETPRPAVVGSRVPFVANFLGRRIAYTYGSAKSCRTSGS